MRPQKIKPRRVTSPCSMGLFLGGRTGNNGIGVGRGRDDSGVSAHGAQGDSSQTDFLRERASLEMGMGPRRPGRGIDDALRWDKMHSGWWSFFGSRMLGNRHTGSEVGGKKTGRKGQEGRELGALSKGG